MNMRNSEVVYPIGRTPDNDYQFTTDAKVVYIIYSLDGRYFIPGFPFSSHVKYMGFRPKNGISLTREVRKKSVGDRKIMNTICHFLLSTFDKNDEIIMAFNYTSEDGKGPARNKYFNDFYLQYGTDIFHKMDFELGKVGQVSIIFRKDNMYFTELCTITSEDIIKNIQRLKRR